MKAWVLHDIGDLRYEDVPMPEPEPGWALVQVKAAGICASDIPRVFTTGAHRHPLIPGHEFSGIVCKTGREEDSYLRNSRVSVFPLIPCQTCAQCRQGRYEMCEHYDYLGSRRDGGFAEYVSVPVWNLCPIPENIPFETAALTEPLAVSIHAVRKLDLAQGDTAAVIGSGFIGFASALYIQSLGYPVTLIGENEEKREIAESLNILYMTHEQIQGERFSKVIEAVGSASSIRSSIMYTDAGGKLVMAGNPKGEISLSQETYWQILRRQITVEGSWNSRYAGREESDWTEAVRVLGECNIRALITHRYRQEELMEGLLETKNRKGVRIRTVTVWNEE